MSPLWKDIFESSGLFYTGIYYFGGGLKLVSVEKF